MALTPTSQTRVDNGVTPKAPAAAKTSQGGGGTWIGSGAGSGYTGKPGGGGESGGGFGSYGGKNGNSGNADVPSLPTVDSGSGSGGYVSGVAGAAGKALAGAVGTAFGSGYKAGQAAIQEYAAKNGGRGGGGGSGSGGSGAAAGTSFGFQMPETGDEPAGIQQRWAAAEKMRPTLDKASIDRADYYDRTYLTDLATQQIEAARRQYNGQVDRAVDTQAAELNRALADAQGQFRTQQDQIALNERQAMDNAALYAEARGDKGGLGLAQYNSIQNTAAQNKLAVSQAQTKLATDTARQISDLRARGEFDKADKMLELTQTYLSELRAIEQYAANYNMNVDQMNTAIAEWEADFNRASEQYNASWNQAMMNYTGGFSDGTTTVDAEQQTRQAQAQLALSLIQSGVHPDNLSQSQLAALSQMYGLTRGAIIDMYNRSNT